MTSRIERLFTNRGDEIELFAQIARRKLSQRVLAIQAPEGYGKTWLIDRYEAWCKAEGVPCVRMDFDASREGGPLSPEYILEKAGEIMGVMPVSDLAAFARLLKDMAGRPAQVDVGTGAVISGSRFGDIANIIVKELHVALPGLDPQVRRRQATHRFRQALAACGPQPAVWLVDSCEKAQQNPDTADWLCGAIVGHVACDESLPLVIVLAGRSLPDLKSDWEDAIVRLKLKPFKPDHVGQLARERFSLNWDETIAQLVWQGTGGVPQAVMTFIERVAGRQEATP